MTDEQTTDSGLSRATRRALLVAGGTAAIGAVAAAAASPAEAANGQAFLLGTNNSASKPTYIKGSVASGAAIQTYNVGKGHASAFQSTEGNGFIGGTYSASAQGANCANYATTSGTGTGLTASGGMNTGVFAVTAGPARYAGKFESRSATASPFDGANGGGAVLADGGIGDGVIGLTGGDPNSFSGVTGLSDGGSGVFGVGFTGVQGYTDWDGGAAGIFAQADGHNSPTTLPVALILDVVNGATDAMQATGDVRITGDLFVDGTIHTNHAVDTGWVPPAAAKVRRNAQRSATKARAALSRAKAAR